MKNLSQSVLNEPHHWHWSRQKSVDRTVYQEKRKRNDLIGKSISISPLHSLFEAATWWWSSCCCSCCSWFIPMFLVFRSAPAPPAASFAPVSREKRNLHFSTFNRSFVSCVSQSVNPSVLVSSSQVQETCITCCYIVDFRCLLQSRRSLLAIVKEKQQEVVVEDHGSDYVYHDQVQEQHLSRKDDESRKRAAETKLPSIVNILRCLWVACYVPLLWCRHLWLLPVSGVFECSECWHVLKCHWLYQSHAELLCNQCLFHSRTFFRRYAHKKTIPPCESQESGARCVIDSVTRRRCTNCRFQKCLSVGMKAYLVTQAESMSNMFMKPKSIQFTVVTCCSSTTVVSSPTTSSCSSVRSKLPINSTVPRPLMSNLDLHINDLTLVEKVKMYEMLAVIDSSLTRAEDVDHCASDFRSAINTMTIAVISRAIMSLNTLNIAQYLGQNDRRILLKGAVSKIIFLKSIPDFDPEQECWIVFQNRVSIAN